MSAQNRDASTFECLKTQLTNKAVHFRQISKREKSRNVEDEALYDARIRNVTVNEGWPPKVGCTVLTESPDDRLDSAG